MDERIKNEIYYYAIHRRFIFFALFIFILMSISLILTTYILYGSIMHHIRRITLILCIFFILVIISGLIGSYPHHGPLSITIRNENLCVHYKYGKDRCIPWKFIYSISEKREICIPSNLLKCKKSKEYRVYYYERDKLKWFCVSEEVGKRIQEMWEEWKRKNLKI